jgi:hypothetical protein
MSLFIVRCLNLRVWAHIAGGIGQLFRGTIIAALLCLCFLTDPAHASGQRATDIVVSCGTQVTRISTGSRRQNIEAIRITVDPANQCRVEASLEFRTGAVLNRNSGPVSANPTKSRTRISNSPASTKKCFVFAGQSYCE